LQQLNKRSVHRAMEIMGARAAMRAGTEIQALAFTTEASRGYMSTFRRDGGSVKAQLDERDTTSATIAPASREQSGERSPRPACGERSKFSHRENFG
jgi:hypothetical protein